MSIATRGLLGLTLFIFLTSCIPMPPLQYNFDPASNYYRSYDEVWESLINLLADINIPIKTIEKASGIVATDEMNAPIPSVPPGARVETAYYDCGVPGGLSTINGVRARYNVFVRKLSDNDTSMRINVSYSGSHWLGNDFQGWVTCLSKGGLEEDLHARLKGRLGITKWMIGVLFDKDAIIVSFSEKSPAREAGLQVNDKIIKINDTSFKSNGELTKLLRSESNTDVKITVVRGGRELDFIVDRNK